MKPVLYIFSGLPGTGKTTLGIEIAKKLKTAYFRLDTIEQAIRDICKMDVQGEGYRITYRIVEENLRLGNDVVVDCVNPWGLTRREWEETATKSGARYVNIEITCSDKNEHRNRAENRKADIEGFRMPTWDEIVKRDYEEWKEDRIVIETNTKSVKECVDELLAMLLSERKSSAQ